jgi:hypothetical protein
MSCAVESEPYPNPHQLDKTTKQEAVKNLSMVAKVKMSDL